MYGHHWLYYSCPFIHTSDSRHINCLPCVPLSNSTPIIGLVNFMKAKLRLHFKKWKLLLIIVWPYMLNLILYELSHINKKRYFFVMVIPYILVWFIMLIEIPIQKRPYTVMTIQQLQVVDRAPTVMSTQNHYTKTIHRASTVIMVQCFDGIIQDHTGHMECD